MPKLDGKAQSKLGRRVQLLAEARNKFLELKRYKPEVPTETSKKCKKRKRKSLAAPLHDMSTDPHCHTELLSAQQDRSIARETPPIARSSIPDRVTPVVGTAFEASAEAKIQSDTQSKFVPAQSVSSHPFVTDLGDHCETPFEAYADVAPLLRGLAHDLGLSPAQLRIYDPYYCEGGAKVHLAALGFTTVINENVDFYKVLDTVLLSWNTLLLVTPSLFSFLICI